MSLRRDPASRRKINAVIAKADGHPDCEGMHSLAHNSGADWVWVPAGCLLFYPVVLEMFLEEHEHV